MPSLLICAPQPAAAVSAFALDGERDVPQFLREHDHEPWRVWSNLEFIDDEGRVNRSVGRSTCDGQNRAAALQEDQKGRELKASLADVLKPQPVASGS